MTEKKKSKKPLPKPLEHPLPTVDDVLEKKRIETAGLLIAESPLPTMSILPEAVKDEGVLDRGMAKIEIAKDSPNVAIPPMQERMLEVWCAGYHMALQHLSEGLTEEQVHEEMLSRVGLLAEWKRKESMGVTIDWNKWDGWWTRNRVRKTPTLTIDPSNVPVLYTVKGEE